MKVVISKDKLLDFINDGLRSSSLNGIRIEGTATDVKIESGWNGEEVTLTVTDQDTRW